MRHDDQTECEGRTISQLSRTSHDHHCGLSCTALVPIAIYIQRNIVRALEMTVGLLSAKRET
jgi:hypothetical protein